MSIRSEALRSVNMLHELISEGYVEPYQIVELMSDELRDWLGGALYAYSANKDAVSTEQMKRTYVLDELTGLSEDLGMYDD